MGSVEAACALEASKAPMLNPSQPLRWIRTPSLSPLHIIQSDTGPSQPLQADRALSIGMHAPILSGLPMHGCNTRHSFREALTCPSRRRSGPAHLRCQNDTERSKTPGEAVLPLLAWTRMRRTVCTPFKCFECAQTAAVPQTQARLRAGSTSKIQWRL